MTNLEKYNRVFMKVFNVSEDALNSKFTFKDVTEWDSVAHLSLVSELEDTFDIMLDADDILHYGSYLNGICLLKKYNIEIDSLKNDNESI